jgi:hypothetical protein
MLIDTPTPAAIALQNRLRSYALGAAYGFQFASAPDQCPPLDERSIGTALSQFEAGFRTGFHVGFSTKHGR